MLQPLRPIKSIRSSLPTMTAIQLANSFNIWWVYCCSSIFVEVPKYQLDRLQSILNVAVRLVFGISRYDHLASLLRDRLHWLRVSQCIDFKRRMMVFKALHFLATGYISYYCIKVSTNQRWYPFFNTQCLRQRRSNSQNIHLELVAWFYGTL